MEADTMSEICILKKNSPCMNKFLILPVIFYSFTIGCTNEKNKIMGNEKQENHHQIHLDLHFDTSLNNAREQEQKESNGMTLSSSKETDYFIEPGGAYEKAN